MFFRLLLLFTFIPILEIYFLIKITRLIGGANTLVLIFVTGFIGAWLLRRQSGNILADLQRGQGGETPLVTQGILIFIGAVLLLTPGVVTDAVGLSLIFPLTQKMWKKFFVSTLKKGIIYTHFRTHSGRRRSGNPRSSRPYSNPDFPNHAQEGDRGDHNQWEEDHQSHHSKDSGSVVIDIKAKNSETRKK